MAATGHSKRHCQSIASQLAHSHCPDLGSMPCCTEPGRSDTPTCGEGQPCSRAIAQCNGSGAKSKSGIILFVLWQGSTQFCLIAAAVWRQTW
jgi:hypothetical protein